MKRMTIDIENWKHVSSREVLKIIKKGIAELQHLSDNDFDGAKPLDSAHYNDYDKSGVVVKFNWK